MIPLVWPLSSAFIVFVAGIIVLRKGLPITGFMISVGSLAGVAPLLLQFVPDLAWYTAEGMPAWLQASIIIGNAAQIVAAIGIFRLAIHSVNKSVQPTVNGG